MLLFPCKVAGVFGGLRLTGGDCVCDVVSVGFESDVLGKVLSKRFVVSCAFAEIVPILIMMQSALKINGLFFIMWF